MNLQKKYWEDMVQLRFELYYLEEYLSASHKYDNFINIIMAIASSSSIAAWALWNSLNFVWSSIIALSQVINATKTLLPYNKRTKFINRFHSELCELFNEYDYKWYCVANGELTTEEINELINSFRLKRQKIYNGYLINNHLPKRPKLITKANTSLHTYFSRYY